MLELTAALSPVLFIAIILPLRKNKYPWLEQSYNVCCAWWLKVSAHDLSKRIDHVWKLAFERFSEKSSEIFVSPSPLFGHLGKSGLSLEIVARLFYSLFIFWNRVLAIEVSLKKRGDDLSREKDKIEDF